MLSNGRKWVAFFSLMLGASLASTAMAAPLVTVGVNLPTVRLVAPAPPVVVVAQPRVWIPAHYTSDRFGQPVFVAGHWRGDPVVRQVVAPPPPRRVVVVRR